MGVSFVGGSISTVVLGVLDTSQESLRIGLIAIVPTCYLIGGILFYAVSKVYPKDLEKESPALISLEN